MNLFYVQQMNVKALNWFLTQNVIFVFRARSRGASFSVYRVPYQPRGGASCNNIYMPMNVLSRLLDTHLSRFPRAFSSSVAFKRQVR